MRVLLAAGTDINYMAPDGSSVWTVAEEVTKSAVGVRGVGQLLAQITRPKPEVMQVVHSRRLQRARRKISVIASAASFTKKDRTAAEARPALAATIALMDGFTGEQRDALKLEMQAMVFSSSINMWEDEDGDQ
jgi:hypothetical protein